MAFERFNFRDKNNQYYRTTSKIIYFKGGIIMTFTKRVKMAMDKKLNLVVALAKLKAGEDVDFDQIIGMVNDIYTDEIKLICELEHKNRYDKIKKESKTIEIPSFMNVRRGA